MNAPANPSRAQYEPIVLTFLPTAEGDDLQHRATLLLMRDRAIATKPIVCDEAWHLLDLVERVAGREALRPMKSETLAELRRILIMCVATASSFDTLFAPPLPTGEVDARV